mmetsp:Transcript_23054/g.74180  ORF Transcript_23054/g.74180 Transcript_23054/m.74180 type:complete len:222 (+) Transcript_23054:3578-4243(+)
MAGALEIDGMIKTCCEMFTAMDQGTAEPWKARLFSNMCDDPKLFVYACCCPCILAGQISEKQDRNCVGSCVCACCCPACHLCGFGVPDRRAVGKSTIIEDCVVMSFCNGCCGRVQLAKELGVGVPKDANELKAEAKAAGEKVKEEVTGKPPDAKPADVPPETHADAAPDAAPDAAAATAKKDDDDTTAKKDDDPPAPKKEEEKPSSQEAAGAGPAPETMVR